MQPYFFPYIGYFQLVHSVDKFIFYDDVAFIKQGWINRNNILMNNSSFMFSIPVSSISSFEYINKTKISYKVDWTEKFMKTIFSCYSKSPYFDDIFPRIEKLIKSKPDLIADLAKNSVRIVFEYLGAGVSIVDSSSQYFNSDLKAEERIMDICKKEKAEEYINPIGGRGLYDKNLFSSSGIELNFIKSSVSKYKQYSNDFIPWLSMIDVLMFNSPDHIKEMLYNYELI